MPKAIWNEIFAIDNHLLLVHLVHNEHGVLWNDPQHEFFRWQCIHEYGECSAFTLAHVLF